jgi:aminopeptidase N
MVRLISFLLFLNLTFVSKAQDIDVLHYQFLIDLNDKNDTIKGLAVITFIHQTKNSNVSFDLTSVNNEGKGMKALSVSTGSEQNPSLAFTQSAEKISIGLPPAKKGDTLSLFINYKGIPADGLIISKNKYGERTFFADNWPNRAHHWIPCTDRPDDKAMFEFRVTAPAHYSVISNGIKYGEKDLPDGNKRTSWKEEIPQPTKVMVIGVAKFATKTFENSPKEIPVSAWVYPQDSTKGFYDYALAPEILNFFSDYIAPYPYKKLANVQSKTIFGGMENASAIFYAENTVTGDRSSEDLLAHEIAHQWFGDMASEKSFAHVWLSEGFATYLTNLYLEKKYGREAFVDRLEKDREEVIAFTKKSSRPVIDSTKNLMSLLNANSYQKGGWILHMLRNEVGDLIFQKILQTYYQQFKGGNADTKDFEAIAEKVSGKELTWFFNQWLYRPGIPLLKMETKIQNNELTLFVKQQGQLFRFNLSIEIIAEDGETINRTFEVMDKESAFRVPVKGSSVKFSIDPGTKLLYELKD